MTFNIKARVLLELGAELISSDGIALYELIKNSVDAKASISASTWHWLHPAIEYCNQS
jgi:hypothetical protein